MKRILYLLTGGGAGTVARYFLSDLILKLSGHGLPYGTFIVNIVGCAILGTLVVISETRFHLRPGFQLLLMAGFCGAFTTFSTFILEISHLIRDGYSVKAFGYLIFSVSVGFLFFRLGVYLAENFLA